MGLLDRLSRRSDPVGSSASRETSDGAVFATRALPKFLASLTSRELPVLVDLGPVVGANVSFFGEQLGCKIVVLDLFADWDRHVREDRAAAFPVSLDARLGQEAGTVDGVLGWDLLDYVDRESGQALAARILRILRPGGSMLGLFGNAPPVSSSFTKYVVVDEGRLQYRPYPAARGRHATLPNRDILRLFSGLDVAESFLLKNNIREILFRKPVAGGVPEPAR
jgi:hypothetical protein